MKIGAGLQPHLIERRMEQSSISRKTTEQLFFSPVVLFHSKLDRSLSLPQEQPLMLEHKITYNKIARDLKCLEGCNPDSNKRKYIRHPENKHDS